MSTKRPHTNDLRARYTQRVLEEKLLELLEYKTLDRVTVKELCEAAQINRTTFYKHYLDIFDLMAQLKDNMLSEIIKHVRAQINLSEDERRTSLIEYLRFCKSNARLYIILVNEHGEGSLSEQAWNVCKETYLDENLSKSPGERLCDEYLLFYKTYGNTSIIEYWLRENTMISPESLADLLLRIRTRIE